MKTPKEEEQEEYLKSLPEVLCLAVAPFGLSNRMLKQIKDNYNVIEQMNFKMKDVSLYQTKKPDLVLVSSLNDITSQSSHCRLQLYIYQMHTSTKQNAINQFYLEADNHYCHREMRTKITGTQVRKHVDAMYKVATSDQIVSLGNPARMLVNSEQDLALILKLADDKALSDE